MPVRDEEQHLADAVEGVLAQGYPGPVEVVVAVGPSHDRTAEVAARIAAADPRVRVVANPSGRTPAGLNAALAAAHHEIIVRVDGHGVLSPGYLRTAVETLARTGAANVGGVMAAVGSTPLQAAVACAMRSPLGVGGAAFHVGGQEGAADTVYLGVFRREWLDRVGGYDERFVRAQDWELNHRIRLAGGLVWFTPALTVAYRPRGSLRALARQYRDYGRWRRAVIRRYPHTITPRYLAPPAALVAVSAGTVAGLAGWAWGWTMPAAYATGVLVGSLIAGRRLGWRARGWLPVVIATMHGCWAWGFLTSRVRVDEGGGSRRPSEPASRPDARRRPA
jgi:glycosyltransferase involved in cell wall biosynthesis